jgi:hypothetical protein
MGTECSQRLMVTSLRQAESSWISGTKSRPFPDLKGGGGLGNMDKRVSHSVNTSQILSGWKSRDGV